RKVEELEDFGTAKKQETEMDVDKQEFSKAQMADGSKLIERFLSEFTETPDLAGMKAEDVSKRVNELRAKYEGDIAANPWVQNVIATL
ncbi:hypothetical protein IWW50_006174, partial [Coemansia erecta]